MNVNFLKKFPLADSGQHLDDPLPIRTRGARCKLLLKREERRRTCFMSLDTEWSHDRPDRPTVRSVIHPLHEAVKFKPVSELRDVRAHAPKRPSQLTQRHRRACPDQRIERLILGRCKRNGLEDDFETLLDVTGGPDHCQHEPVIRAILEVSAFRDVSLIVHGLNYTCQ